jgi:hypothetical protein
MGDFNKLQLSVNGEFYNVEVLRRVQMDINAPRLVTVCYNHNEEIKEITRVCIDSIRKFTPEPNELWVVDNNSPKEYV